MRCVCSTNQEETKTCWKLVSKALHNLLATVTPQSPHRNDLSFLVSLCLLLLNLHQLNLLFVEYLCEFSLWKECLPYILRTAVLYGIQMRLSRSGSSSTALRASLLGLWVFTLIFITFSLGLYVLRPTCLVVPIRKFVIAFHMSIHSGNKCHSYSYKSSETTNNPSLTFFAC